LCQRPRDRCAAYPDSRYGGWSQGRVASQRRCCGAHRRAVRRAFESLRLQRTIVRSLCDGRRASRSARHEAHSARLSRAGAASIRRARAGRDDRIRRCHPHDPSWRTGRLEHAVTGSSSRLLLINKSFNLVTRARILGMRKILLQIARIGTISERLPTDESLRQISAA
jgi:hypothetical protein